MAGERTRSSKRKKKYLAGLAGSATIPLKTTGLPRAVKRRRRARLLKSGRGKHGGKIGRPASYANTKRVKMVTKAVRPMAVCCFVLALMGTYFIGRGKPKVGNASVRSFVEDLVEPSFEASVARIIGVNQIDDDSSLRRMTSNTYKQI